MPPHPLPDTLQTADGLSLRLRHEPLDAARGTVLVVHGLGEHHGRHALVMAVLRQAGFKVLAYDQRGHGASGGGRGDIARPDSLLQDLAMVIDAARDAAPHGPLLLLGHSLGGLIAARFVAGVLEPTPPAWSRPVDALVLSSPALDPGLSTVQKALLALAGRLAPHLAVNNGLKPEWISRDPAVVAAYRGDPLVHDRISATLARFIVDAARAVQEAAPRWRMPTLLMWAGADRCVAPAGSARFAAAAPAGVVTAREFASLYHEIFNEPERAEVFAALRGWLTQRFGDAAR